MVQGGPGGGIRVGDGSVDMDLDGCTHIGTFH